MAESQDVNALKRRGRRRLVGAIALVLLAAIVLPMVFDPEPRSGVPPVNVRIPSEDGASFSPKAGTGMRPAAEPAPKAVEKPVPPSEPAQPAAKAPEPDDAKARAEPPAKEPAKIPEKRARTIEPEASAKPVEKPVASSAPTAAPAAAPAGEQFVVPVAALAQADRVKELVAKLKSARLPHYTEPVATAGGTVTRIRVGPYSTRESAEDARLRLERIGLKPGKVLTKP